MTRNIKKITQMTIISAVKKYEMFDTNDNEFGENYIVSFGFIVTVNKNRRKTC